MESLRKFLISVLTNGAYESTSAGGEIISEQTFNNVLENLAFAKIEQSEHNHGTQIVYNLKINSSHDGMRQLSVMGDEFSDTIQYNKDEWVNFKIEQTGKKVKLWVNGESFDLSSKFSSIEKVQEHIADSLCKRRWREQGVPESYLDSLLQLKNASRKSGSIENALRSLHLFYTKP